MKIYLARHGEYQNPEAVVPYQLPGFPLTELGKSQAQKQAEHLHNIKIRDIFTSPIERCVEAATIIGQSLKLHPNIERSLIETYTPMAGMKRVEILALSQAHPYDLEQHINGGGESIEIIYERMNNFIQKLRLMSGSSAHLLVSHGDPMMIYLSGAISGQIPHTHADFTKSKIRYIPMGGLVCLDYGKSGLPKYTELI